jgi:hypothetical protein
MGIEPYTRLECHVYWVNMGIQIGQKLRGCNDIGSFVLTFVLTEVN